MSPTVSLANCVELDDRYSVRAKHTAFSVGADSIKCRMYVDVFFSVVEGACWSTVCVKEKFRSDGIQCPVIRRMRPGKAPASTVTPGLAGKASLPW